LVYAAGTLKDTIETNWALTGTLLKVGSETDTMKETVNFFGHPQITSSGEYTKAVEVIKVNEVEDENIILHPRFQEVSDRFVITCRYRVLGGDETMYDEAESDIEDGGMDAKLNINIVVGLLHVGLYFLIRSPLGVGYVESLPYLPQVCISASC